MKDRTLISRRTSLTEHIVQLCRHFRTQGFVIGPNEEADALKALSVVILDSPYTFKSVLAAVLVKSVREWRLFDDLYQEYWAQLEKAEDSKVKDSTEASANHKEEEKNPHLFNIKDWHSNKTSKEEADIAQFSSFKNYTQKDLSLFNDHELEELKKMVIQMARRLSRKQSRRLKSSNTGKTFDLRRSIRKNMRRGGEMLEIAYRTNKKKNIKLLLICDVSKSMELYSQFLILFVYAFQQVYSKIESFVFSTELFRITEELKERSLQEALEKISAEVPAWGGGTRIGESLWQFVQSYGDKLLDKQTIVLIISDGWDTGEGDSLENSMSFIHKKSKKIIWLNPLAGRKDWKPEVKAMNLCLPYIHSLAPAHNIESLRSVMNKLFN